MFYSWKEFTHFTLTIVLCNVQTLYCLNLLIVSVFLLSRFLYVFASCSSKSSPFAVPYNPLFFIAIHLTIPSASRSCHSSQTVKQSKSTLLHRNSPCRSLSNPVSWQQSTPLSESTCKNLNASRSTPLQSTSTLCTLTVSTSQDSLTHSQPHPLSRPGGQTHLSATMTGRTKCQTCSTWQRLPLLANSLQPRQLRHLSSYPAPTPRQRSSRTSPRQRLHRIAISLPSSRMSHVSRRPALSPHSLPSRTSPRHQLTRTTKSLLSSWKLSHLLGHDATSKAANSFPARTTSRPTRSWTTTTSPSVHPNASALRA